MTQQKQGRHHKIYIQTFVKWHNKHKTHKIYIQTFVKWHNNHKDATISSISQPL